MRELDLSPLFRYSIGFDGMADLIESLSKDTTGSGYPPYNIEKISDNHYQISMAVAGFSEDDIDITVHENFLVIKGNKNLHEEAEQARVFLHRGIAQRSFIRRFQIADNIDIEEAIMEHGLLHINLTRHVPEEEQPKKIAINKKQKTVRSII